MLQMFLVFFITLLTITKIIDGYRSRLGFTHEAVLTVRVGEQQETMYKLSKSPCNPGKQRVSLSALVPTLPCSTSSVSRPLHSSLNRLAPVRLPSPPITHRLVMPRCTRLWAAFRRPSWVRNSLQRALPITVPPWGQRTLFQKEEELWLFPQNFWSALLTTCSMLETLSHVASLMLSPPSTIPWYPWKIFF